MKPSRRELSKTVPEWEYDEETKSYSRADVPRGQAFTLREVSWLRFLRWLIQKGFLQP